MKIVQLGLGAAAAATAFGLTIPPAHAVGTLTAEPSGSDVQAQINTQLRDHPGGRQLDAHRVAYKGGSVVMTFPAATRAATPCPTGWYCFYQYKNFGGRMLQFRDCGGTQYFTDYGFKGKTTSWRNTTGHLVITYEQDTDPIRLLWRELARSESSFVGEGQDNRADYFDTICNGG
ncbi:MULTISPECIES: peptidase inhibitor family I36 protein [Actinomadura]|uniref:Peptidase inhibitor family I36 protein n=1 Tax=Actinomadura yumaensis TaxID=111807 RepID=A0ABW2CV90_9ACTN|nr:peptidase inhibitor family I36 protein [Actinomadura sp. J1-007]